MKYIYFGANIHINVLDILHRKSDTIIYVDSLPKNPYGYEYKHTYYTPRFYNDLISEFFKYDYYLHDELNLTPVFQMEKFSFCNILTPKYFYPKKLVFKNYKLNKEVYYYISSGIPRHITYELIDDMKDCYNLIICGHHPNNLILNFLKLPLVIYGYNSTVFESEGEEESIIFSFENYNNYNLIYYLVDYKTNNILNMCNSIEELNDESKKYW